MEVRRRIKRNKIINDIRDAETFIKRSEDTIKRIKGSNMGVEYIQNQIEKLKTAIVSKTECLEQLKNELLDVNTGELDDNINDEYKKNTDKHNKQKKERKKANAIKKEESDEKKEVSKQYWKGIISESRAGKQTDRDIRYAYKYLNKVVDQIPDYIQKNLSEMPNNKGYIWRGVHLYGDLKEQSGPRVMFEKQRGGILVIHEYTAKEYRRYEKTGKERKQLVHKEIKKIKATGPSLMDYVKK